ncbi:MAG: hypothetical protein SGI99_03015 [Pseudomonadota bacterium]|nr:hypothetical protein [Pseudomonadota bacterium]
MKLRKKIAFAFFALTVGISSMVSAADDACTNCDTAWWQCGGAQNDYCTARYERCMRRNGCPLDL